MCRQYVNANITLFRTIAKNNNNIVGFLEPFDCIVADELNNIVSINDFNIISHITLLGSKNNKANNILDKRDILQVCVRLTKCTKAEEERLSVDLDEFTIDTSASDNIMNDACIPYLNFSRITPVGRIDLDIPNPRGSYVVKLLVKTLKDELYTVQSIYHLQVK